MVVYRSKIGPKGQITLPKAVRKSYHLNEGEEVLILANEEGIVLQHPVPALRGMLRGKLDTRQLEKDIKELRGEWRL